MKATFLASIAVAALFGAPAFAADMAVKAPPLPPPALNWTGCYIGGQVGFAGGLSEHSFSNGAPSDSSSSFGALGGGLASCDYQWNNFVLGVEGDFEAADLTGNFSNATGATSVGTSHMTDDGSVAAASARFLLIHGYSMSPADGLLRTTISVVARFHLPLAAASPQILMAGPRASVLSMRSRTAFSDGSSTGTPITARRPVLCRLLFQAC